MTRTGNRNATAYASLPAAVTALGSSAAVIEIPSTTTVSSSLTIPANITLKITGVGRISVSASQTLTVNGAIDAPLRQIFTGAGTVRFGARTSVGYPEWFGAAGDGSTNDATALDNTQLALSPGTILYLSPKTYLVSSGLTFKRSGITWKSQDGHAGTIKRTDGHLFVDSPSFLIERVAFEGVSFDAGNSGFFIMNITGHLRELRLTRCRAWKFGTAGGSGYAIHAGGVTKLTVEDSLFHNPGNGAGTSIVTTSGASNVDIQRNRFLYCAAAYVADDTGGGAQQVTFKDNFSDEAWPYLVATVTDSGREVTYSSTVLTDRDARFGSLAAGNQVRVLPVRVKGVGEGITYTRTTLTDTDAPFGSVREGDIVRSGSSFAIVAAKVSNSVLQLEEWLSDADRQGTAAPAKDTAYTIYRLLLGNITSNTGTTIICSDGFFDIDGARVTPSAGDLYEILYPRPSHAVTIESACKNVKILDNTIKRSGADQIIATANEQEIRGNHISYGWDMGITLWGSRSKVERNTIKHQGVGGVWTNGNDNLIANNEISDSRWVSQTTSAMGGDITVQTGNRNRIQGNLCNRFTTVNGNFGILIAGEGGTADGNIVQGNTSINHLIDDITIYAAVASDVSSDTHVEGNTASVISQRAGTGAAVTGTRFWNNRATTLNLSTGFFAGTYRNAHLKENQARVVVAAGTTVTGTNFGQGKVTNSGDGTNRENASYQRARAALVELHET